MKSIPISYIVFFSILCSNVLLGQLCSFGGGFGTGTGAISQTPGTTQCFDRAFSIGDDISMTNLVVNGQYRVETCGEAIPSNHPAPYNSYIGVWTTGGTFIGESSGGTCGNGDDESYTFTATATTHIVQLRDESCNTGFQLHDFCVTYVAFLPVELTSFKFKKLNNDLLLLWQTATEVNNKQFEIEVSQDGKVFEKIGAVQGNGSTLVQNNYSFTVHRPKIGRSYYRLKQLDYDGQFEYSKVITVYFNEKEEKVGTFYPNPSNTGFVNLDYAAPIDGDINLVIYDITGKILSIQNHEIASRNNYLSFNFSGLTRGVYLVKIGSENHSVHRKLIIQ